MKDFLVAFRRKYENPLSITQLEHPKSCLLRVRAKNHEDAKRVVRKEEPGPIVVLRVSLLN